MIKKIAGVLVGVAVTGSAFAAAPDVSAVTDSITDGATAAGVVGIAMLAAIGAVKGLKLIRRAF